MEISNERLFGHFAGGERIAIRLAYDFSEWSCPIIAPVFGCSRKSMAQSLALSVLSGTGDMRYQMNDVLSGESPSNRLMNQ